MLVHSGNKMLACTFCNKLFSNKESLDLHAMSHGGDRPFVCNLCSRTFPFRYKLNAHQKEAHGEKLYGCNQCSMQFPMKWRLNNHMRVHTGEKPFKCKKCGKRFTRHYNLKAHMEISHKEVNFVSSFNAAEDNLGSNASLLSDVPSQEGFETVPSSYLSSIKAGSFPLKSFLSNLNDSSERIMENSCSKLNGYNSSQIISGEHDNWKGKLQIGKPLDIAGNEMCGLQSNFENDFNSTELVNKFEFPEIGEDINDHKFLMNCTKKAHLWCGW